MATKVKRTLKCLTHNKRDAIVTVGVRGKRAGRIPYCHECISVHSNNKRHATMAYAFTNILDVKQVTSRG